MVQILDDVVFIKGTEGKEIKIDIDWLFRGVLHNDFLINISILSLLSSTIENGIT